MKFTLPGATVDEPGAIPFAGKTHLVVTVHGIRTYGHWQEALGQLVESHDSTTETVHYQFGYFSAIAFLVPFVRDLVVRRPGHQRIAGTEAVAACLCLASSAGIVMPAASTSILPSK